MCDDFDPDVDIRISDVHCPNCVAARTLIRDCKDCDDGFIDLHESDPDWFDEDEIETCLLCRGSGFVHWCSLCGYDFNLKRVIC